MRRRTNMGLFGLIAKVLVWVAGKAIEAVPVIGPIMRVVNFVNDVAEVRKGYAAA